MNKKGDVPITILVLGIFLICGLAIFTFFYSINFTKGHFKVVDKMQDINFKIEENSLNSYSDEIIKTEIKPQWGFDWTNEKTLFSVKYGN